MRSYLLGGDIEMLTPILDLQDSRYRYKSEPENLHVLRDRLF